MTTPNFTSLLTALRAFVLKSRPAYRDYLGTESVEEKTVLLAGTLSATGESVTAADGFAGFTNGQTYKATIGEETVEVTAQYGTGSFSECIVIGSSNVAPSDTIPGWMVCVYNGNLLGFGTGDWAGKQIEVATSKMVPVEKWDVKKLPEECLPEKMPEKWAEGLDTGGGVLYVPMEINYANSQGIGTVSGVTFEEAQQARKDGKMLVAVIPIYEGKIELLAPMTIGNSDVIIFEFINPETDPRHILIQWLANGQAQYQVQNSLDYKIIPVTVTQTDGDTYTATTTADFWDASNAVDAGKSVWAKIDFVGSTVYIPLSFAESSTLLFSGMSDDFIFTIIWYKSGTLTFVRRAVLSQSALANNKPLPAGEADSGTGVEVARADHVHPSELYFVPMTVDSAGDGNYTTTTTAVFDDVKAAAESGKSVWAKVSYLGDLVYIPLNTYASSTIIFSGAYSTKTIFTVYWLNENQPRFVRSDMLTDGSLADSTPLAAGEASSGTGVQAARADHVHPSELPVGATANQQLVTDSDGSTKWEDRPGGYTSRFTGDYVYAKSDNLGAFSDFCQQNEYNVGDTLTVICNGTTYEDVPITTDDTGSVHLEQTGVFSFGNVEYAGSGFWNAKADTFPDGVSEVTFKNVHQVNDVLIPVKYLPTSIEVDEMHLNAGSMTVEGGQLKVDANMEVRNVSSNSFYVTGEAQFTGGYQTKILYDESTSSLQLCNDWTYLRLGKRGQLTLYYDDNINKVYNVLIKGVRAPVDDTDAVNKKYVDSRVGADYLILASSTTDSTKKFKITVDDSGTLTATEVTTTT